MKYTADDLFLDETDLEFIFIKARKKINKYSKKIFSKLIDIDYYYYTIKILQNIPEAFLITYLGFFATFNLLRYTETSYGNRFYTIVTPSMYPEIKPGSLIYSSPSRNYKKGDIISYVEKTPQGIETGKILTHRIIDQLPDGSFITKGDANKDADPKPVVLSQIDGKVIKIIPNIGYIEILSKTLPGFLIIIVAPCAFLIVRQIKIIRSNIK